MTEYSRHTARGTGERAYRVLLRAYPADFRREFGDAMAEFFHDRLARAHAERRRFATPAVWARAVLDVLRNVVPVRIDSLVRTVRNISQQRVEARRSPAIHEQRRKDWMLSSMLQDARYAVRAMLRQPAFTIMILATLTLGIGANAAIFSVVNAVLLRPLPFRDPQGIVHVEHKPPYQSVSEPEFFDYKREVKEFETLAAFADASVNVSGGSEPPERLQAARVSDGFFRVLGVQPVVGRAFLPEEDSPKAARVVMISYGTWQRRFGGDPAVAGKELIINGTKRPIVGVMPPHFNYPAPDVEVWVPLRLNADTLWTRNNHYLQLIGRLAPGASVALAEAKINLLGRRFLKDFPDTYGSLMVGDLRPIEEMLLGRTRPYLFALLGTVAFVLLIACVNVANLLLARGESRRREMGLRTALGASRTRLARQMLTESFLYSFVGGIMGLLVAWAGVRLLVLSAPDNIPRLNEVGIDTTVLLFTLGISVLTGLMFGLLPALRGARDDGGESLKAGGKTGGQARGLRRARRALVIAEVALAVVTLTGAGLMLRSLSQLHAIDLGIRPEQVLSVRVGLPEQTYQGARAAQFYTELLARVRTMPGVVSAGAVGDLPIADGNSIWSILIDGQPPTNVANAPSAMPEQVTPQYFRTMGIPIVKGREFTEADRVGAPLVVIVNEAMEKKYWPQNGAMGHTIKMLDSTSRNWATIVGVVKNVRHNGFLDEPPPAMFFPHAQSGQSAYYVPAIMNVVVKSAGNPLSLTDGIRTAIRALEPLAPVARVQSMEQIVATSIASRTFATRMLTAFAVIGLLLAGIGIYGVISYGVTQRTFEIGLRLALGARREQVLRLVISEGAWLGGGGLVIGVAGALGVARFMKAMLVGVTAFDPLTIGSVVCLLGAVSLMASWLPARRATAVNPIQALRGD